MLSCGELRLTNAISFALVSLALGEDLIRHRWQSIPIEVFPRHAMSLIVLNAEKAAAT